MTNWGTNCRRLMPLETLPVGNMMTQERVVKHTLPMGMAETFVRNSKGDVVTHTTFNGDVINYEYDTASGRVTRIRYPDGSENTMTYDTGGRLSSATDASGTIRYLYDSFGRPIRVDSPNGVFVVYSYTTLPWNRESIPDAIQRNDVRLCNAQNRLQTVTDGVGHQTTYTCTTSEGEQQRSRIRMAPQNSILSTLFIGLFRLRSSLPEAPWSLEHEIDYRDAQRTRSGQ